MGRLPTGVAGNTRVLNIGSGALREYLGKRMLIGNPVTEHGGVPQRQYAQLRIRSGLGTS